MRSTFYWCWFKCFRCLALYVVDTSGRFCILIDVAGLVCLVPRSNVCRFDPHRLVHTPQRRWIKANVWSFKQGQNVLESTAVLLLDFFLLLFFFFVPFFFSSSCLLEIHRVGIIDFWTERLGELTGKTYSFTMFSVPQHPPCSFSPASPPFLTLSLRLFGTAERNGPGRINRATAATSCFSWMDGSYYDRRHPPFQAKTAPQTQAFGSLRLSEPPVFLSHFERERCGKKLKGGGD